MSSPSFLRLQDVRFAFRPDVVLLDRVSLHLSAGWTAVVGPNGAGKTTLLRLLSGALSPTAGQRQGPDSVHHCPQRVDARTAGIEAFAWGWTGPEAWALQSRLELDPAELDRWDTLSPGERKRWQVGAALASRPPLLLLDEPTNHLDGPTRALLLAALAEYDGIGVVVSHDRALLRSLPTAVVRVADGTAECFAGGWTEAELQWEQDRLEHQREVAAASRDARTARRQHVRAQQDAAATQRGRSMRGVDPRDHDAKSDARKSRAANAATHAARRATVTREKAQRAAAAREALTLRDPLGRSIVFEGERAPRSRLIELVAPQLHAGARLVLRDLQLVVDRQAKVWIRGPNGAGKTTLVRALLAACSLPTDRVVQVPQVFPTGAGRALLDRVRALPSDERGRVLTAVAALGVAPGQLLASEAPSPGEARKLAIADGLGRGAWLLVLDEPANHLDLPSVQRLEQALGDFPGAVVLVSHDVDFGTAVASEIWTLSEGRVAVQPVGSGPPG